MSKNELSRTECWFFLLVLYVLVVLIIYACHFHAWALSYCTTDWGGFGSYLGGMVSIVSIILLYLTLREQHKENYRLRIETGYNRMLDSLTKKYYENKEAYDSILNTINNCRDEKESSAEICNMYEDAAEKLLIIDLYNTYSYIIEGIENEGGLDGSRKEHYFQNMIYSLPVAVNVIIFSYIIHLSSIDEKRAVSSKMQERVKKMETGISSDNNTSKKIIGLLNKYEPYRNYRGLNKNSEKRSDAKQDEVEGIREVRDNFLFMIFSNKNNEHNH